MFSILVDFFLFEFSLILPFFATWIRFMKRIQEAEMKRIEIRNTAFLDNG